MIERSRVRIHAGAPGEFSSQGSTFCADSYFGIRSLPRVTAVACKRRRSFCQTCRWQVTAKHAYTLRMWLCMEYDMEYGCMVYTELAPRWQQFHVAPAMPALEYTTSVDIQKTRYKKLVTHVESHASSVSLLKRAENSAI